MKPVSTPTLGNPLPGRLFRLSLAVALASGCSGDNGSSSATCNGCSDVAGAWTTTEIVDGTACGSGTSTENHTYTVAQTGCQLTVTLTSSGQTFQGTACNNTISWSGSFPESGGTTTITSSSYTLSGSTLSGTAHWTWTGGGKTCSGTTAVTGTKQ
jgi:hypothetical protein